MLKNVKISVILCYGSLLLFFDVCVVLSIFSRCFFADFVGVLSSIYHLFYWLVDLLGAVPISH